MAHAEATTQGVPVGSRAPVAWYVYLLVGMPLVFYAGAAVKGAGLAEPFEGQRTCRHSG